MVGPNACFHLYKRMTTEELNNELKELKSILNSDWLKEMRKEEVEKEIDDTNCMAQVEVEVNIVENILAYKEKFPHADISEKDYWEIERAIQD